MFAAAPLLPPADQDLPLAVEPEVAEVPAGGALPEGDRTITPDAGEVLPDALETAPETTSWRPRLRSPRRRRSPVVEAEAEAAAETNEVRSPRWKPSNGPIPKRAPSSYLYWVLWFFTLGRLQIRPSFPEQLYQLVEELNRLAEIVRTCNARFQLVGRAVKGGVGKTSVNLLCAQQLRRIAWLNVLLLDGNPDFGTLGIRLAKRQARKTIIDLVASIANIRGVPDLMPFVDATENGVWVLASNPDPMVDEPLDDADFAAVLGVGAMCATVTWVDGGTSVQASSLAAALANHANVDGHQTLLITTPAKDALTTAIYDLNRLRMRDGLDLERDVVVIVNRCRRGFFGWGRTDLEEVRRTLTEPFKGTADGLMVLGIPEDRALRRGVAVTPKEVSRKTDLASLQVMVEILRRLVESLGSDASTNEQEEGS